MFSFLYCRKASSILRHPINNYVCKTNSIKFFVNHIFPSNMRYSRNFHSIIPDKYTFKSFYLFICKQKILLRGAMVKNRTIDISLPYNLFNYKVRFTLSNLAGHSSFILLAMSYMENDFYYLRVYAMTGITFSIIFQYYRPIPLWIPIRWNTLFFFINVIMIILLIKEENQAVNIPEEQQDLYRNVFLAHGSMRPVDFLHLMSLAKRRIINKGEKLIGQGSLHHSIHLVQSGNLTVEHDQNLVGKIHKNQFVGAMSYLTWEESHENDNIEDNTHKYWNVFDHLIVPLNLNTSNNQNTSSDSSGERGHADVICDDVCVVYSWTFEELHELLELQPNLGFVFEKSVSADLNKKITITWKEEPKLRYKEILAAVLVDGDITDKKKEYLSEFRSNHNISEEDHNLLLVELNWSKQDFEYGMKGGPSITVIQEYEKLIDNYLSKSYTISDQLKHSLREYRIKNKINQELHLKLLSKHGWSLDEYEIGRKSAKVSLKDKISNSS